MNRNGCKYYKKSAVKKIMKREFLRFVIFSSIPGCLLFYISNNREFLTAIREIRPEYFILLVVMDFLFFLSNALILKTLLQVFKLKLTARECLGITAVTATGNFLASVKGGTFIKAFYLKKEYDLPYSSFIALIFSIAWLNLILACFLGMTAILLIGYDSNLFKIMLFWIFIALSIGFCVLPLLPFKLRESEGRAFRILNNVLKGWLLIRGKKSVIIKSGLLLFLNFLIGTAELIMSYRAFSIDVGLTQALLMDVISVFIGVIKIIPANFGIYEGSVAMSSKLLGVGFDEGLLASGLLRVISLIVIFALGGIFGSLLINLKFKDAGSLTSN